MNNSNVSISKIDEGIEALEEQFMLPLERVGQDLIDNYKQLNEVLDSDRIRAIIVEQQAKLDSLKSELKSICLKAKGQWENSVDVISNNQNVIDDELSNI